MHAIIALKHIRRSPYQSLSAIMIMTFTFFVVSLTLLLSLGAYQLFNFFEAKPQITIFFKDTAKTEDIESIKADLLASTKTSQLKYVTKKEALAIYREQNKKDPLLLEMVTADILPSSLEVSAYNLTDLKFLYNQINQEIKKNNSVIEEIVYQRDLIDNLSKWTNGMRIIGFCVNLFLIIDSILIILTIISMKIASRKEEIEILQLLGATNNYIRTPFIIEGFIYGLTGAFLGWLFTVLLLWQLDPFLKNFLSKTPLYPISPLFYLFDFLFLIACGLLIGLIGSFLAVKRYLK